MTGRIRRWFRVRTCLCDDPAGEGFRAGYPLGHSAGLAGIVTRPGYGSPQRGDGGDGLGRWREGFRSGWAAGWADGSALRAAPPSNPNPPNPDPQLEGESCR